MSALHCSTVQCSTHNAPAEAGGCTAAPVCVGGVHTLMPFVGFGALAAAAPPLPVSMLRCFPLLPPQLAPRPPHVCCRRSSPQAFAQSLQAAALGRYGRYRVSFADERQYNLDQQNYPRRIKREPAAAAPPPPTVSLLGDVLGLIWWSIAALLSFVARSIGL